MRKAGFLCLLAAATATAGTVVVNPRDPAAHATLREAAAALKPGDTLVLAPASGPYREELFVPVSGTPDAPITIEGNGNEVTGFDILSFQNGEAQPSVKYPFVLRHNGRRIAEDTPGRFGGLVIYNPALNRLVLAPGTSEDGWEISVRRFAVRVQDASHQIYRNLTASGSLNDGFNLHGEGLGLVFEGISGCQNLDEGFSSHDSIRCIVSKARFFENDNGMLNGQQTVTVLEDVDFHDNLGIGLGFNGKAGADVRNARIWNNGLVQLLLRSGVTANFQNVDVFRNDHKTRPWLTYQETAKWVRPQTVDDSMTLPAGSIRLLDTTTPQNHDRLP